MNIAKVSGLSASHLASLAAGVVLSATLSTGEAVQISDPRLDVPVDQVMGAINTVHLYRSFNDGIDNGFTSYEVFFSPQPISEGSAVDILPRRLGGETSPELRPQLNALATLVESAYCAELDGGPCDVERIDRLRVVTDCGGAPCVAGAVIVPGSASTVGAVYRPTPDEGAQIVDAIKQFLVPAWCASGGYCPGATP